MKETFFSILLDGILTCLGRTLRQRRIGYQEHQQLVTTEPAVIYCFWHAHQLGLLLAHRDRWDLNVLVSLSRDGRLLSRVLAKWGISWVGGSSSRGGAEALEELRYRLEQGLPVAIAPDGPRGPRRSIAPGCLALARWSGLPIVPVAVAYARKWQLNSWDRFQIPCPFSKMVLAYGTPLRIPRPGKIAHYTKILGHLLMELSNRCEAACTSSSP